MKQERSFLKMNFSHTCGRYDTVSFDPHQFCITRRSDDRRQEIAKVMSIVGLPGATSRDNTEMRAVSDTIMNLVIIFTEAVYPEEFPVVYLESLKINK